MAHIGGLGGGAVMGAVHRLLLGERGESALEQGRDPGKKAAVLLNEALKRVEKLDMREARAILQQVLDIEPNNRTALTQMFHVDKVNPNSDDFHTSTRVLLSYLVNDRQAHREALAVYREYIRLSSCPRLPLPLFFALGSFFAATGHLEDAEKIMGFLLKRKPNHAKMPEGLLHVARACLKDRLNSRARSYLQVICMRYPLSGECAVARRILDDQCD